MPGSAQVKRASVKPDSLLATNPVPRGVVLSEDSAAAVSVRNARTTGASATGVHDLVEGSMTKPSLCTAPACEEPLAADDPSWCAWHSRLLYDHRQLVDAPRRGNDSIHAQDSKECPACSLGVDPRQGLCAAPACEERAALVAEEGYREWCGLHGSLLLDHQLDELDGTDLHYHPSDRSECPACNGWSRS